MLGSPTSPVSPRQQFWFLLVRAGCLNAFCRKAASQGLLGLCCQLRCVPIQARGVRTSPRLEGGCHYSLHQELWAFPAVKCHLFISGAVLGWLVMGIHEGSRQTGNKNFLKGFPTRWQGSALRVLASLPPGAARGVLGELPACGNQLSDADAPPAAQ